MYERRKSLRLHTHSPDVSGLVTSERKSHSLAHETVEGRDNSSLPKTMPHTLANMSDSERTDGSSSRKRKKHYTAVLQKRLKRSSVESRTVSVTRIDTPIYEKNFLLAENGSSELSPVFSPTDSEPTVTDRSCITEGSTAASAMDISGGSQSESPTKEKPAKVKQRKFRVSLTLPDALGKKPPGKLGIKSPLPYSDKVAQSLSSPRRNLKSPSFESDSCAFTSPGSAQNSTVPFLASPLPTTSKKQLETDSTKETKPPTKAKHVREHPGVLNVAVSAPVQVNAPVTKTQDSSHHQSMSDSHSAEMGANVCTRLIDAGVKGRPLMDSGETSSTEVITSSSSGSPRGSSAVVPVVTASSVISPSNSLDGVTGSDSPDPVDHPVVITSSEPAAPELITSSDSSLTVLASSDSMMDIGDTLTGGEQPSSCTMQGKDPINASLILDVGVHGRSATSSPPSTNPVAISTIDIPTSEGVGSTADNDCPAKTGHLPCCSPRPLVSPHCDPITVQLPFQSPPATTPSVITIRAASLPLSRRDSVISTPGEEPSSRNSTGVCSSSRTPHENNVEISNAKPSDPTKASGHRPGKVLSSKAEPSQEMHLPVHVASEQKPQDATGAPTPVITKTPQGDHLAEVHQQQIVKADTAKEQLPPDKLAGRLPL